MSSHPASRPTFVGRVDEIAHLEAEFELARSGRGRLVLLSGPPGIGKSRLAAEFAQRTTANGVKTLFGRSWEAGGAPPYWPWIQVIRGHLRTIDSATLERQLGGVGAEIAVLLPELDDNQGRPSQPESRDAAADRFRLFDSTSRFFARVAESDPLVIVLEDLQAADVPSLLLLEFIANLVADESIMILATYRDVELSPDHPLTSVLAGLHRAPATSELVLGGLGAEAVSRYLEVMAGSDAASTLAAALHRRTGGNPLFLSQAVRLITSGASDGSAAAMERVAIPAEIRTVLQRRLGVLSPDCHTLLESLSVLGNGFDVEVAAEFAEMRVEDVLGCVGEATGAGLVVDARGGPGTFNFAHDLIRQTLYANLPPVKRVHLHRRAATILERSYGPGHPEHLAELALHYFEGSAGGSHLKAVEFARLAGEQALRRLAYEEAVRLLDMAVQTLETSEIPDPETLGSLLLSLGDARVKAGDLQGAGRVFRRAADLARRTGDAALMARAAAGYGGRFVFARAGNDTDMVPLLQDALVMLGGQDDELRVRLLSRLSCATRSVWDRERSAALARQAVEIARRSGDPPTLVFALTGLAGAIWWAENAEERLSIGRELVELGKSSGLIEGQADGHMTLCFAYGELGDFAEAREELRLMIEIGGSPVPPSQRWVNGAMSAVFVLSDGFFAEAEDLADEMLHKSPVTPARDNVSAAWFQRFLLRREQGRLLEIEPFVRQAAEEFPWYPVHRLALANLMTITGRIGEASSIFNDVAVGGFARLHRDNYWVPSMCLAAEVVVGLGIGHLTQVLKDELTPFAGLNAIGFPEGSLGAVARYLGLLAWHMGDHDLAEQRFREALEMNRRNGARPWVAHTHYEMARTLMDRGGRGDEGRAKEHLRLSSEISEEVGLVALREELRTWLPDHQAIVDEREETFVASLRREGDYYSIIFHHDAFKLRDSKGLQYLSSLLGSPGREIHVLDLVAGDRGVEPSARGVVRQKESRLGRGDAAQPLLDRTAREAYQRRIGELEEEMDEADRFGDGERAAGARMEHEFLVTELASAVGLGGRDRISVSAAERARINVTRSIRAALSKIHSNSEVLGRHLDSTIRTGVFCSYNPDPLRPLRWDLSKSSSSVLPE